MEHQFGPISEKCLKCGVNKVNFLACPDSFKECGDWGSYSDASKIIPPKEEPQIVYVSGRTFWDWLSELEWPKRKALYKTIGCTMTVVAAVGIGFCIAWFHHFGAEWARVTVEITGLFSIIGCVIGFAAIISEGFK